MKKERLEDLGRLRERLDGILKMDIFDHHLLSKHNEAEWYPSGDAKWKEDHDGLIELLEDKLDDCRRKFLQIQDELQECFWIAKGDEDES